MLTCPQCQGKKQSFVHLNYGGKKPNEWKWVNCWLCDGSGAITEEHGQRVAYGREIAADRKARLKTLRAEAAELGCSGFELSKVEMGQADVALIEKIARLRSGRPGENLA